MTEREKCAEILARLKIPAWNSYIDAMIEARDLARREALNEAANFIEDDPNPYRWIMGAKIRSLIPSNEVAPAAKLLSQPSPETVQCDAHLCVTGNYEKGDRRDCKYENPLPKSASAPPDTKQPRCDSEAWKRVPVDAGMLVEKLQHLGLNADGKSNAALMWDLAIAIKAAARAKLGE